jgi:hypothetical protein
MIKPYLEVIMEVDVREATRHRCEGKVEYC